MEKTIAKYLNLVLDILNEYPNDYKELKLAIEKWLENYYAINKKNN